jgi:hypothetical protein
MNSQIESWRVQQYAANVYQLSQQKGSRLAQLVRKEQFKGKAEFFDRLGLATAQKKPSRNSDTPNLDITHSRRMVTTEMYEWATLVDRKDKLENIHSPENEYSVAARNALGRSMDDILIASSLGVARAGEGGASSVILPNTAKCAALSGVGALDYLNLNALLQAKFLLDSAEVEGQRYLIHRARDLQALLGDSKITSADYAAVKALVAGEVDSFLGFRFIRSERLPLATANDDSTFKWGSDGLYSAGGTVVAATDRQCVAFVGDGLILGMNEQMQGRIDERSDKSYSSQVYASMDLGGVRMEEEKVISILVKA